MSLPYHAKDAMVLIASDGSSAASELLRAKEWTLDLSRDPVEVTAFGSLNKEYVQGLPDVSGTINGFVEEDEPKWFLAAASSEPVRMYLYWSRQMTSKYCKGLAWVNVSLNNANTGANEISMKFIAGGPWSVIGFDS